MRHEMREKSGRHGTIQERNREIFYDTDHIYERQKERITPQTAPKTMYLSDASAATRSRLSKPTIA